MIPLIRTAKGETFPLGSGRSLVRAILASISLSMYIFNKVVPEIAKNKDSIKNRKLNQSKALVNSTSVIRYENIAV